MKGLKKKVTQGFKKVKIITLMIKINIITNTNFPPYISRK